jgi:hypothetical protein
VTRNAKGKITMSLPPGTDRELALRTIEKALADL